MSKKKTLVTVITPAYNRASFLDETILSVINQDYPHIEYIVIDDGSTDNSLEVIKKYSDRIRWISHQNLGETRTVNKGFSLAKGDIVVVVNSDDPLLPGAVSAAVTLMEEQPDLLAVYPDWNEIGPDSEFIKRVSLPTYDLSNMLTDFNIGMGPGTFIRRSALDMVGMRDTAFKYAGDLELWFRLALHGRLAHIPQPLATHRTHPDSLSVSDRGGRMADELILMLEKVYTYPKLALEYRRNRSRVFSNAHYDAASYCGVDRKAARRHYAASLRCSPIQFGFRSAAALLKGILPRRLYDLLKSRYLKHTDSLKTA